MKKVRFKYVFFLMFALLFANLLCINLTKVEAEETIDLNKAYRGEIEGYWALVNFGDNLVGTNDVTIFLDPEAINNNDINYILINEIDSYGIVHTTYYQRGVHSQFAARFTYRFVEPEIFGMKPLVIHLMSKLDYTYSECIEKIKVTDLEKVRTIEDLTAADFEVIQEVTEETSSAYRVFVSIKNNPQDYRLKEVVYQFEHKNYDGSISIVTGSAIEDPENNRYYFIVSENSIYTITIEDRFGFIRPEPPETLTLIVDNFVGEVINIVPSYNPAYTRENVLVHVEIYDQLGNVYPTSSIEKITVMTKEGVVIADDIKNIRSFEATQNGVYVISCITTSGTSSFTEVNITNIDREAPIVVVSDTIYINSSEVESYPYIFNPLAQIIATDNATAGDRLSITIKYYHVNAATNTCTAEPGDILEYDVYHYLYGVNDVCVTYEVKDEAYNSRTVMAKIVVTDNTLPTISYTKMDMTLEIGDAIPTDEELMAEFGLSVNDNSKLYDFADVRPLYIDTDLSQLNLEELGVYNIFIYAVDASGNEGIPVKFIVTVTVRRLFVEAVPGQYAIYGETDDITISYTCNGNPCLDEILPRDHDKLVGELYILSGAKYAGIYDISSSLAINSEKYKIELGNLGTFKIKQRTFKIVANSYSIDYKDDEPVLTWYMDTSVCSDGVTTNFSGDINAIDYSCTFVHGDSFGGGAQLYGEINGITHYSGGIKREAGIDVKFDDAKNVIYYKIHLGNLVVNEFNSGGRENYYLDFFGLYNGILYEDYARFYIYPKYVEVTLKNVVKVYGEADPNTVYDDTKVNAKKGDGRTNYQYEFTCNSFGRQPINAMTTAQCQQEIQLQITREEGESTTTRYKIIGESLNDNYDVRVNEDFDVNPLPGVYLTILQRNITIEVDGDPLGSKKYLIIYEDDLPIVTVSITNSPLNWFEGLATQSYASINDGSLISFTDELVIGANPIKYVASDGTVVSGYVPGAGIYSIEMNEITIKDGDGVETLVNYNLNFVEGELEVIQRHIYIKIVDGLTKVYGDSDPDFSSYVVASGSNYVVDGNKHFILQIYDTFENGDIVDDEDYEPLDKNLLKYYMKRTNIRRGQTEVDVHDGEMVGEYLVEVEKFENASNYVIAIYQDYYFEITKRTIYVSINNASIEFSYTNDLPKVGYSYNNVVFGDTLVGQPQVSGFNGDYRNNGQYRIGLGNIRPLSSQPEISSSGNMWYINGRETDVSILDIPDLDLSLIEVENGRYCIVDIANKTRIDTGISIVEVDVMWNYEFDVVQYGTLTVTARNIVVVPHDGYSKIYGDNDPIIRYSAKHYIEGVIIDAIEPILDSTDFSGILGRVSGEKPGEYEIIQGTLTPSLKGAGYNFRIVAVESGHVFTINKKDLTLKLAAAVYDSDEGIYKVELAYGDSLDILASGYTYMNGTDEAGPTDLCTLEMVNGIEVCDKIYDTVTGSYGVLGNVVPEDVGRYILNRGTLRIIRVINKDIDVTHYYNFEFIETTLIIVPREIRIYPISDQKIYGENDSTDNPVVPGCGIGFTYSPTQFVKPTDRFSGCLQRQSKINAQGQETREDVGDYLIELGTLTINTNYRLIKAADVMYYIVPRPIIVTAIVTGDTVKLGATDHSYTMQYEPYDPANPPFTVGYIISGMGLASNSLLGIDDRIVNNVQLQPEYIGVGDYKVVRGQLYVENARNYSFQFNEAQFKVTKKIVTIKPIPMSKIYDGDESTNPVYQYIVIEDNIPQATGALSRIPGEDANKYLITQGTLSFGANYIIDMDTYPEFFTIHPRKVTIRAKDASKVYSPDAPDPEFEYEEPEVEGGFIIDEEFAGKLARENPESQAIGKYQIIQGTLSLSTNYKIIFVPAVYTIYYIDVTDVYVKILSGDKYQLAGEEKSVRLYAQFNYGANPELLKDVSWSISKSGGFNVEFSKDTNNIIEFLPSGIGTYTVTASYNGITGFEFVVVSTSNVNEIFITLIEGSANQILGAESKVAYSAQIHLFEDIEEEMYIQWFADDTELTSCKSLVNGVSAICSFIPNTLGIGTHNIYAKISNVKSDTLHLVIKDNEVPKIILIDQRETIRIESHLNHTANSVFFDPMEKFDKAIDDIDGDISKNVVVKGVNDIDYNKVGTYYVIYEVKDQHGHIATNYRTIIIEDTVAPVVKLEKPEYENIVLEYGQDFVGYGGATATDLYDNHYGLPLTVMEESNLDLNKIGTYTITYFAVDSNGNRGQVVRTVVIKDTTRPTITLNGNRDIYIEYKGIYREYGAEFSDNYDGTFTIYPSTILFIPEGRYEEDGRVVNSVDTGVLGTYRLSYYQTDSSGNAPLEFPVRNVIVRDTTPPVIILKGSNPYYLKYGTEYVDPGYEAIDNYDSIVEVSVREVIGNTLGTYYVYYDACDSHDNIAVQVIRTIILVDLVSPTLGFTEICPQHITIEALTGVYPPECDMVDVGYTVTDDYLPDIEAIKNWVVISSNLDITTVGEYEVIYYVEDASHNKASLTRYVSVVDTTPPEIRLIEHPVLGTIDFFIEVFGEYQEPGWIVYDQYDEYHRDEGLVTRVEVFTNLNVNKLNTYTIEYIAIDSHGNESEPVYREVTVRDAVPPVVTLIGDPVIIIERGGSYAEYGATAIDNYDGVIPVRPQDITGQPTGKEIGSYDVKYCVKDSSGNEGCATREVKVVDTIPPTVLGVQDGAYYRTPVNIYYSPLTGTDEVLTGRLNGQLIISPWYVNKEGIYNLVVSDDAGNTTEIDFVIDTTPPVLYGANNGEYINHPVTLYALEELRMIAFRLNNGGYVTTDQQTLYLDMEGKYWVYAVDMAGNVSDTISFVVDTTPPVYSLSGVVNGGITDTNVTLNTENDVIVSVNNKDIPTNYTFSDNGYYQITIRDLAGNDVFLQFVINKEPTVQIGRETVTFISQNNAIGTFIAKAGKYPKSSGFIYAKPLLEGGFEYVSGTLFSDEEYNKLISGEDVSFAVPGVAENEMIVAFIVTLEELNKFTTQTVEGDEDSAITYAILALVIAGLIGGSFYFFVVAKRKKSEEEEEEEEIVEDNDFYY